MSRPDNHDDIDNDKFNEQQSFRFLNLPPELRNQIYEDVLQYERLAPNIVGRIENGHLATYNDPPFWLRSPARPRQRRLPSVLRVNRQIRQETGSVFLGDIRMRLMVGVRDLQTAVDHLRLLMRQLSHDAPFHHLTLNVTDITWANFEAVLPLLELIRTTNFSVDDNAVFQILARGRATGHMLTLAHSLRRAVRMGVRARRQGWSAAMMQNELRSLAREGRGTPAAIAARRHRSMRPRRPWYERRRKKK